MKPFKPPTKIEIKESSFGGQGCFATELIKKDEVIEICKVLQIRSFHALIDYAWFDTRVMTRVLALGYGSLYNHSFEPNIQRILYEDVFFKFKALRDIQKGEEVLVNYGKQYWHGNKIKPK